MFVQTAPIAKIHPSDMRVLKGTEGYSPGQSPKGNFNGRLNEESFDPEQNEKQPLIPKQK